MIGFTRELARQYCNEIDALQLKKQFTEDPDEVWDLLLRLRNELNVIRNAGEVTQEEDNVVTVANYFKSTR